MGPYEEARLVTASGIEQGHVENGADYFIVGTTRRVGKWCVIDLRANYVIAAETLKESGSACSSRDLGRTITQPVSSKLKVTIKQPTNICRIQRSVRIRNR